MTDSVDATLAALVPPEIRVCVGGQERILTPVTALELPALLRACAPIFSQLAEGDYLAALVVDADAALQTLSVAARMPREEVDTLQMDVLIELAGAVVEVNVDFFVRAVMPAMGRARDRATRALAGSTSSPNSSAQDSPEPT